MKLSKAALEMLSQMFSPQSNLQLPVAVAELVLEVRQAVAEELSGASTNGSDRVPEAIRRG